MRPEGLEPPRVAPQDPKSCASTSSATVAGPAPTYALTWLLGRSRTAPSPFRRPTVPTARSSFPLFGTERGSGGEDRNGAAAIPPADVRADVRSRDAPRPLAVDEGMGKPSSAHQQAHLRPAAAQPLAGLANRHGPGNDVATVDAHQVGCEARSRR